MISCVQTPRLWGLAATAAALLCGVAHAQSFGVNLVANPGAEEGPASPDGNTLVDVPGWARTTGFTVVAYGTPGGFPTPASPGPADRGLNFFVGGPAPVAFATQSIDLSQMAGIIDAGRAAYDFSAYLGGKGAEDDNAVLSLVFTDENGSSIGTTNLVGPSAIQRGFVTGLLARSRSGPVPPGARTAQLVLLMSGFAGGYNDGSADAISLVISRICPWSDAGCVADYNGSGGTPDDADIAAFFNAWNNGDDCADANNSGGTPDDADIAQFFNLWNNGGC